MNDNLENNFLIRTNEKPHNYKVCNKEFSKKGILNNYIWMHPGKRLPILLYIPNPQQRFF